MSGINNYFSNNNIFNGTEIPTQGKFDVGDIVVNIGENAEEEPMWMCIEAGEPGVWKVVGKVEEIDLSGYQEKTDENLVTESKDLVGAINELFQNANNGKQLIASAIGEPLNSNDTFSAMSNNINGLLSTFKTNMMNNGVTVNSGDKFKQLIDKISTMVEEGNGKGIQYAEGTFNITIIGNYNYDIVIDTNLDFNPTLLFLTCGPNVICNNIHNSRDNMVYFGGDTSAVYIYSFDSSSIILRGMTYKDAHNVSRTGTWYAIGVGEEDTTFRDSLASILQEEGVEVTEEDDMASLITKVDEEFDRQVVPAGDALPEDVVSGKTFMNSNGELMTGIAKKNDIPSFIDCVGYKVKSMPVAQNNVIASAFDGKIYLFNGANTSIYIYDPKNNNWETKSGCPSGLTSGDAVTVGDYIYFSNLMQKYKPATNEWVSIKTSLSYSTNMVAVGRTIYFVSSGSSTRNIMCYNTDTDAMSTLSVNAIGYSYPGICAYENKIYICSGMGYSSSGYPKYDAGLFCFNTLTNSWDNSFTIDNVNIEGNYSYNLPASGKAMQAVDGRIFVFGGRTGDNSFINTTFCYDIAKKEVRQIPILNVDRGHAKAIVIDNVIYVLGGTIRGSSSNSYTNVVECFYVI